MKNKDQLAFISGNKNEFSWYNKPMEFSFDNGLTLVTSPNTDFWQKTHYGFEKDDGHCYITKIQEDFTFVAHLEFSYKKMYDQCGIILRIDKDNWIKASVEYEDDLISRLGSVVTNKGYSDWATLDISTNISSIWYRLNKNEHDCFLEFSYDGVNWQQLRMLHLHKKNLSIYVGIYACSPKDSSFTCKATNMAITDCLWK